MPVSIIVGGQFGSEGKGKTALFWAKERSAEIVVRIGGPNSGHTAFDNAGARHVFRHLPTAALLSDTISVLGPGSYIDAEVFRSEIDHVGATPERVVVDPNAFVITPSHKRRETRSRLDQRIGSTLSGTGEAVVDRIRRRSRDCLACQHPYLKSFTARGPVRTFLRTRLRKGERVIVEGTQGFGLSNTQSPDYPKATSRDTTAAAFAAEASISPLDVDEVVLVLRAFPIRVAGDSGPLPQETDWQTISKQANATGLVERTTVTGRVRRVARFDPGVVTAAIEANVPTSVVLNHVDYFDAEVAGGRSSPRAQTELRRIESLMHRRVDWVGVSPRDLILRDAWGSHAIAHRPHPTPRVLETPTAPSPLASARSLGVQGGKR